MPDNADVLQYFLGALPHFLGYFCFAVFLFGLFLLIYLWVTPYAEIELIRGGNLAGAEAIGKVIAERLKEKQITRVVFDRGGNLYHGRIKAVADSARKAGLEF
jgi:hypothetical protein